MGFSRIDLSSEFMQYLAEHLNQNSGGNGDSAGMPSLNELSKELGLSVSRIREQLEVARALGFVEVRPRTGIRPLPYSFLPAVKESLSFAVALDMAYFEAYADLRNQIEAAYWREAVVKLTPEDHQQLQKIMVRAWGKLSGNPIQIPHTEHRQLHLHLYLRLGNPFVLGLLEAYWEIYEAVGFNLYADYSYLQQVWNYHQQMVDAICNKNFDEGFRALVEHKDLLYHRPQSISVDEIKEK